MIIIDSIQIGQVVTEGDPQSRHISDRHWTTGFYKNRVDGEVRVTATGILGDSVADTRHHGGPDKAMLCYSADHYRLWQAEHPELNMSAGGLGENLTLGGATEADVCIGDLYSVGSCQLQVSQPRQPCWKIARRWGVNTLVKEVTQSGRTGWYVRVLQTGTLTAGDKWQLEDRPHPAWSVARANDVMFGREIDAMGLFELMNLKELAEAWRADIA